jgi:hypothetical protein
MSAQALPKQVLICGIGDRVAQLYTQLQDQGNSIMLVPRDMKENRFTLEKYVRETEAKEFYLIDWFQGDDDEMYFVNTEQTWTVLNSLKGIDCKLIIVLTEHMNESTVYGASILAACQLAMAYGNKHKMDVTVVEMK